MAEMFLRSMNTTMEPEKLDQKNCISLMNILLSIGYGIIFTVGVIGNTYVLHAFKACWKHGPIVDLLILYLAFFNLLSSFIDPLMGGYWVITCYKSWHFGWFACKIVPSLCRIFTNVSIALILIMAVDRCRAIVFPFRQKLTRTKVHLLVLLAMIIGFGSEIHHIIGSYINGDGLCKIVNVYEPGYLYPSIISISSRLLLITFVQFFSTLLAYFKLRCTIRNEMLLAGGRLSNTMNKRFKKVTMMLAIMSLVFGITVVPRDVFHLIYIISWADHDGYKYNQNLMMVNSMLKLLQASNVIYNVFIYAKMHELYRKRKFQLSCFGFRSRRFVATKKREPLTDANCNMIALFEQD